MFERRICRNVTQYSGSKCGVNSQSHTPLCCNNSLDIHLKFFLTLLRSKMLPNFEKIKNNQISFSFSLSSFKCLVSVKNEIRKKVIIFCMVLKLLRKSCCGASKKLFLHFLKIFKYLLCFLL